MTRLSVAVVGGGITGLAAAYELRNEAAVTVIEARDRIGGMVATDRVDGIQVEAGPDSLLARDDEPIRLLVELGLGDDIVEPTGFGAWISDSGTLRPVPDGFVMGLPASPVAIATSGLLSPAGVMRAALDLVLPRTPVGDDVSVGRLVRARFGDQMADRIVAPLMSGIRAGDIDDMSLDMAAVPVYDAARRHRSITLALQRGRRAAAPRFIGLRRGMTTLVEALARGSSASIRTGSPVTRVIVDEASVDGEPFDGVIVAAPPPAAARILRDETLAEIEFSSSAVVNLVYPAGAVGFPDGGTGILVPPSEPPGPLAACTFFTRKWPHLAPPDGRQVVRCVSHLPAGRPDDEIVEGVTGAVGHLLSPTAGPVTAMVHRWASAQPLYRVGHRGRIRPVLTRLAASRVRVAGAGYLATGVNDCLAHGRAAARSLLEVHRRLDP